MSNTMYLPKVLRLFEGGSSQSNQIWQYFDEEKTISNIEVINTNPFIILSSDVRYLLTSNKEYTDEDDNEYVLLTKRKPSRADLNNNRIEIIRWLKHPLFQEQTPEEVLTTWKGKFNFIQEDETKNIKGLRKPQIGAEIIIKDYAL